MESDGSACLFMAHERSPKQVVMRFLPVERKRVLKDRETYHTWCGRRGCWSWLGDGGESEAQSVVGRISQAERQDSGLRVSRVGAPERRPETQNYPSCVTASRNPPKHLQSAPMTDRRRTNAPAGGTSAPVFASSLANYEGPAPTRPSRTRKPDELRKMCMARH